MTILEQQINVRTYTSSHRPYITQAMQAEPFTTRIQVEKKPPEAKPFKIKKYNGTGCLYLYLELFQSQLDSTRCTDAQACHAFQETLSEEALSWFLRLPTYSIDSYERLTQNFVTVSFS
ncbi:hypothetical protein ACLB2K_002344 [Fragaria x ananassa]